MKRIKNKKTKSSAGIAILQIMILVIGFVAVVNSMKVVDGLGLDKSKIYNLDVKIEGQTYKGFFKFDAEKNAWVNLADSSKTIPAGTSVPPKNVELLKPATMTPAGSSTLSEWLGIDPAVEGVKGGEGLGVYQTGHIFDAFFSGVQWYVAGYYAVKWLGPALGLEEYEVNALSKAAGWGLGMGKFTYTLAKGYFGKSSTAAGWWGFGIGMAFALYWYAHEYEEVYYRIIEFDCKPWQAQTKGKNCELCNKQELPCSIYQCKSLGQACELLNDEASGEAMCVWINPNDVKPPVIEANPEFLLDGYSYTPDNAVSPPDRGVIVVYENSRSGDGCAPAFTPLRFGIKLDEPAKCKADYFRKRSFDEMRFDLGGGNFKYNHSITMSLPGPNNTRSEGLVLRNNGQETIYIKCQDANGNSNEANFVFKYCVDPGPDTTPPLIVGTNIRNNVPISFNQDTLDLELYINEPSNCKWSTNDESYENMPNEMDCSDAQNIGDFRIVNNRNVYVCKTTLTGIKDNQENKFYFRCKDQPQLEGTNSESQRNTNSESYEFTIIGTRPLYIDSVEPNDTTIKDSTESVKVTLKVETSAGYNEGESICYYGEDENNINIEFFNTASYTHSTDLYLPEGEYEYYIRCVDVGGNSDTKKISFEVESDSEPPIITRAYKEENYLKIITNEPAKCVYDVQDCGYLFEDGLPMTSGEENSHFTTWSTKTKFYIKCQDEYGNRPAPNKCSAIIKPLD